VDVLEASIDAAFQEGLGVGLLMGAGRDIHVLCPYLCRVLTINRQQLDWNTYRDFIML